MKKVLIISYFYPPCNLTASQRVHGWAKYLHKFGYYPIIITRNWDVEIKSNADVLKSTGEKIEIKKYPTHEVHYLPYKASLRDVLFTTLENSKFQFISKIFTLFELIFENYSTKFVSYNNLLKYSNKFLKENTEINKVIISGNPFNLFSFGYHLKRKNKINWIADYRDDWNTSDLEEYKNSGFSLLRKLQIKSEKKWVETASLITSVSNHYTNKISEFVNVNGATLLNGYDFELNDLSSKNQKKDPNSFVITYNGSLYNSQKIEVFLKAVAEVDQIKKDVSIVINFPGLAFDPKQEKRVLSIAEELKINVNIRNRIPKNEVLKIQINSDVLLMVAHENIKGIPSSKLFEYIGLNQPVLVCPTDNDVIEEFLNDTKLGIFSNSSDQCKQILIDLINKKQRGEPLIEPRDPSLTEKYSRASQAQKLAEILNNL